MLNYKNLPIYDLELGIELQGNESTAKESLKYLIKTLPKTKQDLKNLYKINDRDKLQKEVDYLLSGACYCGVPRLELATRNLLISLIKEDPIEREYQILTREINKLLLKLPSTKFDRN